MRFAAGLVLLLGVCCASGCGSTPDSEMQAAYAALEQARRVEAARLAPADFQAAQDTLQLATAELDAQRARGPLTRRYGKARSLLTRSRQLAVLAATEAQAAVEARRERLRQQAQRMRGQAETAVAAATAAVEAVPATRRTQQALEIFRSDLVELTTTLQEAQGQFDTGNYQSALARLEYVTRSAEALPRKLAAELPATAARN